MDINELVVEYQILILPIAAGLLSQVLKLFNGSNQQKFNLSGLASYSGMPSTHSAIVVSLTAIIALQEGISSPFFAIAFILATIVIRDATGLRQYLGQHGKVLNILVKDLKNDDVLEHKYPHLLERIGHTPIQVLAGGSLGLIVSLAGWWLFR